MSYRAIYRDGNGVTYSAPLEWDAASSSWLMRTNEGLQKIVYLFRDDEAGNLFFQGFREDQPPPTEPDTRVHVEPGKNSFAQLQNAGAKATAEYQRQREQQRREMLDSLNPVDAARARGAREANNLLATRWHRARPEPIPPTVLTKEAIGALAEEARYRKRKIEPES